MLEKVLAAIRERGLLRPGDRVSAAVSGGPDSVALLRALLELRSQLGVVLSVAHFHHGIRGKEADADQAFVAELARAHSLPLHIASGDAPACAAAHNLSLETAARELRYAWFRKLLAEGEATRVATGHTLDDQAETVLMRFLRGSGTRGLAGIFPLQRVEGAAGLAIVRPMLAVRRGEVEEYLRALGQEWREDLSNRDLRHARNRIRHELLPLLEREYNPGLGRLLGDSAELARAEEEHWNQEVGRVLPRVFREDTLEVAPLAACSLALQRRLLRAAAESLGLRLSFDHVQELLRLASPAGLAAGACELPGGWTALRQGPGIRFQKESRKGKEKEPPPAPRAYEYRLPVPGEVRVTEIGTLIRASLLPVPGEAAGYNRAQLLDPRHLAAELVVRNWRAGDRFWPAHTKSPKKVKTLLQERHIRQPERWFWPVVASGDSIVWVRGFPPAADRMPAPTASQVVIIEELELDPKGGNSTH